MLFALALLLLIVPLTVSSAETKREITVSAALSLKSAFEEIGRMYEARRKVTKVTFNFGASGDLMRQIEGGAPVDVFASAAPAEMDELEKKGLIVKGTRADFAKNATILVAHSNMKTRLHSFTDLLSGDIKRIAVGNFKTVPAGRYAEEIFRHYKILPLIKDRLIFTANVRQVLDYIDRNEVDAGVVFATDVQARSKNVAIAAVADERSHSKAVYPIGMITNSKNRKPAEEFITLVRSAEGQKILRKYGFKPIGE
ncbi:MAG: molybdate ABC transporter substrate-binding protein [Nitrospirota bacterium]